MDGHTKPLTALWVHDQYGGQPLESKRPRKVPVPPELYKMFADWGRKAALCVGSKPTADDYIVPNCEKRAGAPHHNKSTNHNRFPTARKSSGFRPRLLHSTKHSFITHCMRGGTRKEVLEQATHNARGEIVDQYTHWDWAPLCEAVMSFSTAVTRQGDWRLIEPGEGKQCARGLVEDTIVCPSLLAPPALPGPVAFLVDGG